MTYKKDNPDNDDFIDISLGPEKSDPYQPKPECTPTPENSPDLFAPPNTYHHKHFGTKEYRPANGSIDDVSGDGSFTDISDSTSPAHRRLDLDHPDDSLDPAPPRPRGTSVWNAIAWILAVGIFVMLLIFVPPFRHASWIFFYLGLVALRFIFFPYRRYGYYDDFYDDGGYGYGRSGCLFPFWWW
jgi:hypothetical protein